MSGDKTFLTPAATIEAINENKIVRAETADGHILLSKESKREYKIELYGPEYPQPVILYGGLPQLLRLVNNPELNDGFYVPST